MPEAAPKKWTDGDIVYLRTGSPPLMVEDVRCDGCVAVTWFEGSTLHRDGFHPTALTEDAPPPAMPVLQGS